LLFLQLIGVSDVTILLLIEIISFFIYVDVLLCVAYCSNIITSSIITTIYLVGYSIYFNSTFICCIGVNIYWLVQQYFY